LGLTSLRGENALPALQNGHHAEGTGTNSKLNHIQDWAKLAQQADWSVSKLAKCCRVSRRSLQRHFHEQMDKSPQDWMEEQRKHVAIKLLKDGSSIKETSTHLGFRQTSSFCRWFKQAWGACPSQPTLFSVLHPPMSQNANIWRKMTSFNSIKSLSTLLK
jgi:transcriptional regulator GlxA family with amidase domain